MHKQFLISGVLLLSVSTAIGLAADRVTLKSGGIVEGQVIRDTPSDPLVAINTGGKLLLLNRDEITSIVLDEEGRAEFQTRRDAIASANSAAAHFELYKWAKAQRLFDYADQQLTATLKAEPGHVEARKIVYAAATLSKAKSAETQAVLASVATEDSPVIGLRPVAPAERARTDYDEKILTWCKALLPAIATDNPAQKKALAELTKERVKASDTVANYLDAAKTPDEQTRLAALAGIDVLKPVTPDLSRKLAAVAIADPSPPVRKQVTSLIKSRNDEWAMDTMVQTYISAFDGGNVRNPLLKEAAERALKDLNDNRVYSAMYYYATLEIRTQVSELSSFKTRQIDSYTVQNGAGVGTAVVIPLSFPIQFPELKITSAKTTVCAPCAALSSLSGMDFGNDLNVWAKWLRKLK